MSAPTPATKLLSISEKLLAIIEAQQPDVFTLRRLGVEIESGWKANAYSAAEYHSLKALAELASRHRLQAIEHAKNSAKLAVNNVLLNLNALVIFNCTAAIEDAVATLSHLTQICRDDKSALRLIVSHSLDTLQFETSELMADRYNSFAVNEPIIVNESSRKCIAIAASYGLREADISARLVVASSAVISTGQDIWRNSRLLLKDGSIIYSFHIDAPSNICAEMNFAIADALVEKFDDPFGEFLSINCRPLKDLATMGDYKIGLE